MTSSFWILVLLQEFYVNNKTNRFVVRLRNVTVFSLVN